IQWVRSLRLCADEPWKTADQSEIVHQEKSISNRRHVSKVAARHDHEIRNVPAHLLSDLEADGLLSLDTERIHRVRQIDRSVFGNFLNDLHTAVEIGIERNRDGIIRDRLNQLRDGNLI